MSKEILKERKDALENEFFKKQDERALEELRAKNAEAEVRAALGKVSGISDSPTLDALIEMGITAETLTAVSLVPMVVVAWADGKLDEAERSAILKAFREANADNEGTSALLEEWLSSRPAPELLDSWKLYIKAVLEELRPEAREALRVQLVGGARDVAEAAGGFLGLGNKVSSSEAEALKDLEACFEN